MPDDETLPDLFGPLGVCADCGQRVVAEVVLTRCSYCGQEVCGDCLAAGHGRPFLPPETG